MANKYFSEIANLNDTTPVSRKSVKVLHSKTIFLSQIEIQKWIFLVLLFHRIRGACCSVV